MCQWLGTISYLCLTVSLGRNSTLSLPVVFTGRMQCYSISMAVTQSMQVAGRLRSSKWALGKCISSEFFYLSTAYSLHVDVAEHWVSVSHQFLAFSFSSTNFPFFPFVCALHYNTLLFSSQLLDLDEVPMTSRRKRRAAAGAHVTVPFLNLVKVLESLSAQDKALAQKSFRCL